LVGFVFDRLSFACFLVECSGIYVLQMECMFVCPQWFHGPYQNKVKSSIV